MDEQNSVVKQEELDPDKFGYLSTHYVVSLSENRTALPEFSRFSGLKGEIQVRTLLQHTWAAIDWKFRYKEEREAPKQLRRRLFRISALLEAADNEFSGVRHEIDGLRERYSAEIVRGELDIAINTESLLSYSQESAAWKSVVETASKNGIVISDGDATPAFSRLVSTAEMLDFSTLAELDAQLHKLEPTSEAFFSFVSPRLLQAQVGRPPRLYAPAIIRYLLLSNAPAAKRKAVMAKHKWATGYDVALEAYLKAK